MRCLWHSDKAVLLAVLPAVQAQIARAPVFFGAVRARCFLFVVPCEGREGGSGQIAYSGLGVCVCGWDVWVFSVFVAFLARRRQRYPGVLMPLCYPGVLVGLCYPDTPGNTQYPPDSSAPAPARQRQYNNINISLLSSTLLY